MAVQLLYLFTYLFLKSLYKMVVSVYIYIFTEYIKITAFQTSPVMDISDFIRTDDKHKISIGEPGYPLSALPRGCRVLVATNESYQVGDHDFTKINVIPTVILLNIYLKKLKIPGSEANPISS